MADTVFAFRAEGVIKIIRKLEAAARLAKALEEVLPAMYGIGDKESAEQEALVALATWEEASRGGGSWN
jgi:predicted signal transduction protein with EAL and GGDEF domain